ncbi:hypothetical protein KY290_032278 [Solanum tuberosum]|uniref:Uncharacterized protein n=1 Tax=Solanum tuberosum TaxID=4113 RepID=A0ABQ7UBP5_SOLTU|nr:hypothetical protein KY290_032278 [Solanum tuberosum]
MKARQNNPRKTISKNVRPSNDVLKELFKKPDLAFGKFLFVFDPLTCDSKSLGLMRVTFGKSNNEFNTEEVDNMPPHLLNPSLQLYTVVSREQARELQLVKEGNNCKLSDLLKGLGLKLVGANGLGVQGHSLAAKIVNARKGRKKSRSCTAKQKPGNTECEKGSRNTQFASGWGWVGIIVKPISNFLKGAILHIDTGPGLTIEKSHNIEIERHMNGHTDEPAGAVVLQRQNLVEGLRTIALKLEFGVSRNQIFERTIAVHFTDPFSVILQSQVQATLTIYDSWLDLQEGFAHTRNGDKKPISGFFPLVISPKSRAGILFSVCLASAPIEEEAEIQCPESILNIRFGILGNRAAGAHDPNAEEPSGHDGSTQRQLARMKWRVERLKSLEENAGYENYSEAHSFQLPKSFSTSTLDSRKRGHVLLSTEQGSRITISVLCLPLVAGYVRPPQLRLPNVEKANICCNPPSPHFGVRLPSSFKFFFLHTYHPEAFGHPFLLSP